MLEGGTMQEGGCSVLGSISFHEQGNSMMIKPRSGRPHVLKQADKIVVAKSLGKCRKSSRKLEHKLKNRNNHVSHMCIYRHLPCQQYKMVRI